MKPNRETQYLRKWYLPSMANTALEEYERATLGHWEMRSEAAAAYWRGQHDAIRVLANRLDLKYPGGFPGASKIEGIVA